jgi:hypothetical protein
MDNNRDQTLNYLKNIILKIEKLNHLLDEYKKKENYNKNLVFKTEWLLDHKNWNQLDNFDKLLDNSYKNIVEEMTNEYKLTEKQKIIVSNFFSQLSK